MDHVLAGRGVDTANPHRDDITAASIEVNQSRRRTASPITSGSVSPPVAHTLPIRSTTPIATPAIIPILGSSTRRHNFTIGEQVYITNRITHSIAPGPLDRAAVVTRVRPRQIDFRTFSGHETWRSPGNLRHLTEQEISAINNLLNSES